MLNNRLFPIVALFLTLLWLVNPPSAYSTQPNLPDAPLGSSFTYQGYLRDTSGSPIHDTCDLRFSLWDASSGGAQIGTNSNVSGVSVTVGYFSALVNASGEFGSQPMDNANARYLQVAVRCSGDPSYTTLGPRQALSWTPPTHDHQGQTWSGASGTGLELSGGNRGLEASGSNFGVWGLAYSTTGYTYGVYSESRSTNGRGVLGWASATTGTTYGLYGENWSTAGRGVYGVATATTGTTYGVYGHSSSIDGRGVYGVVSDPTGYTYGVRGESSSSNGTGVYGLATNTNGPAHGVYGQTSSPFGRGVIGWNTSTILASVGVWGRTNSTDGSAIFGWASANNGDTTGVYGKSFSTSGTGVYGLANALSGTTYGVYGESTSTDGYGVYGTGNTGVVGEGIIIGVIGTVTADTGTTYGVHGVSDSTAGRGVYGEATATTGVTYGVYGHSSSNTGRGVYGIASATTGYAFGVRGASYSASGSGVIGVSHATIGNSAGVYGMSSSSNSYAGYFYHPGGYAGYFDGDVGVNGDLSVSGSKAFKIDHPLDPANQYLFHYSVESPEVLNQYSGNVILDGDGEAWVELPVWFQIINADFRYQLTPIGSAMPDLHIAHGVQNNRFKIAGGRPGMLVSWEVTALRNDPYLQQHPQPVEQQKSESDLGTYLHPELYGQPEELGRDYQPSNAATVQPE